jgi:putative DNA primase/helicase
MGNSLGAVLEQILLAIRIFFVAGALVELRVFKAGKWGTISGYFTNFQQLAEAVRECDGKGPGVYWVLNPIDPALLARSANRLKRNATDTTKDQHILKRDWFLVDCDPKRPSGISATNGEHDAALERADAIRQRLREEGWPEPVMVDSGNGAHLIYRIDLPNDKAAENLLRRCLQALAARHDDERVEVDKTTYNASRICKVPGTVARKGDDLPDRPYRLARLLDVPDPVLHVTRELLEKVAAEIPEATKARTATKKSDQGSSPAASDLDLWIAKVGIEIMKPSVPHDGGRKWIVRCPFNSEHDNAAIFELADGRRGFHCFHNSCAANDWQALRAHVDPDYRPGNTGEAAPNPTDVGNAKRFAKRHGDKIRYVHLWQKWLVWDGKRWRIDDSGEVERLVKETIRAMFVEAAALSGKEREELLKHAMKSEHEQRVKAMIALAKSESGIPAHPDQLDRHPFLLNTTTGTINLQTGELQPHRKDDLITKLARVEYRPDARAPIFTRFIVQIMRGQRKMVRYLQRIFGYGLTGSTREQVFFVFFGTGANGKSTLLNIILEMLGLDYALDTPADTFTVKQFGDGIPNDLARLKGARLVTATELEGRKLDEPKLKRMTGQDPITARFMRAEFFQFTAEFKLIFACNQMPMIDGVGYAMWRRIRLIRFDVEVQKPDKDLPEKLRRELPGILAWCVRGCMAWQKFGIGTPDTVVTATAAFRAESDAVGRFITECTTTVEGAKLGATEIYAAYARWCKQAAETLLSQHKFGRKLRERGLQKDRGEGGVVYLGITLLPGALNDLKDLNEICIPPLEQPSIGGFQEKVQAERFSYSQAPTPHNPEPEASRKEWLS